MQKLLFAKNIRWGKFLFLSLTPLIAIFGTSFLIWNGAMRWPTIALGLFLLVATGMSITAGYHRLFAHRSYEARGFVKFLLLMFGAASVENSALTWSQDHRDHHAFVDTDRDPYNINRGFWYAHIGWIVTTNTIATSNVADLERDALIQFQHRHYGLIAVLVGFALPTAVASLWGDALGGLLIAGFARMVMNHHCTFMINSVCHYMGKQPYSDKNTARDSWIPALFTYGEGYHNYHHAFPSDYRNGILAHQWDPTKWLIRALSWIGQTHHLRRVPEVTILRARLRQQEALLLKESLIASDEVRALIGSAKAQLESACAHKDGLKATYRRLKSEAGHPLGIRQPSLRSALMQTKKDYRHAKREFRRAWQGWRLVTSRFRAQRLAFAR